MMAMKSFKCNKHRRKHHEHLNTIKKDIPWLRPIRYEEPIVIHKWLYVMYTIKVYSISSGNANYDSFEMIFLKGSPMQN